ncbi:hypothetical protein PybrP1_001264 [[Pythium] brassicae (nom. inval.)]|nr:hypothetical protein PybrP1_001264 [[Pythium] brassicae (nom. inval.)]
MGRRIDVANKVEDAKKHGLLHLTHRRLVQCPPELLAASTSPLSASLLRLDLSFNLLASLPDALGALAALRVLYVNHNPRLASLPSTLAQCAKLQAIDASATALDALPCEYARLANLKVLDIGATPLQRRWRKKGHVVRAPDDDSGDSDDDLRQELDGEQQHRAAGKTSSVDVDTALQLTQCEQILRKLRRKDERTRLKRQLFEKLRDDVYRLERLDSASVTALRAMLQHVLKRFPLADELRGLVRNAERLFPSPPFALTAVQGVDVSALRRAYEALRDENERKKRAADLEIKIRNLYFDRIDPASVERMVLSIYEHVRELPDVKFLLRHAAALFPAHAKDVDGREIQLKLVALQQEIARERAAAVDQLFAAVKVVYSDTEPDQLQKLVDRVAALFKSTKELRSLAADASTLFPVEFLNVSPSEIHGAFQRAKAQALCGSSAAPPSTTSLANNARG